MDDFKEAALRLMDRLQEPGLDGPDTFLMDELKSLHADMLARNPEADPWLVLEGDWGGQIYLTIPWRLVGHDALVGALLHWLDWLAWECNEGDGARASLYDPTRHGDDPEEGIDGGMGGGELRDGLWLHDEFASERARVAWLLDFLSA
jgi:hypothetical protein